MTINLPVPPSINHAYVEFVLPAKRGVRTKPRAMRMPSNDMIRYKNDVINLLRAAGWQPVSGPMRLSITWRRKIRSGDLSNRVKVLEDALKGLAWHDDSQVVELHCYRLDDPQNPGVTVTVEAAA